MNHSFGVKISTLRSPSFYNKSHLAGYLHSLFWIDADWTLGVPVGEFTQIAQNLALLLNQIRCGHGSLRVGTACWQRGQHTRHQAASTADDLTLDGGV